MSGRFQFGSFSAEWGIPKPLEVERDIDGNWWNFIYSSTEGKRKFADEKTKLEAILGSPAALRVFKINCDLFSLGKINQYNEDGSEKEKDFLYSRCPKPNHFQSWTQFFWDGMFWIQMGTGYMYRDSNVLTEQTQMYWLNPACIDWGGTWKEKLTKFVFAKLGYKEVLDETIKYTWPDGTQVKIKLKEITPFFDLSNGLSGNWFKGESDIDALYQVIMNSQKAMDAKGRNLDFAGKFLVSGQSDPDDATSLPMAGHEKESIEQKMKSRKWVHAVKSKVDIQRFVENINNLKLDEQFFNDYFTIGAMKGIPKDVLEVNLKGATFENQEKATGRHVEYSLKPKGQLITDAFESLFGFSDLRMSWAHCMFNQVFEKDRADRQTVQLNNLKTAQELGLEESKVKEQLKLILEM